MKSKNKSESTYSSRKKTSVSTYLRNNYQLYLMLLLPCLYLLLFKYKPMLGIIVAFKDYNIFKGVLDSPWAGLAHFQEAFSSREFWFALRNTLLLNLGDIIIGFPIPILLAVFLNEINNSFVKKSTQIILYLPHFFSWVIIAGIIQQLFSESGLVNVLLNNVGIESIKFLSSNSWWRVVYWGSGIWAGAGYSLIIYMAALSSTDPSLNEAAYIDGAGRLKRIWYVTIPQIRATITMMLIMALGKVMSISFDRPFMMGNTLVKDASQVISTYVYSVGLQSGRYDFAAAVGVFQSVVGVILVLSFNKIAKKLGEEGII
jgi:putative aldouronate transport system permease protein